MLEMCWVQRKTALLIHLTYLETILIIRVLVLRWVRCVLKITGSFNLFLPWLSQPDSLSIWQCKTRWNLMGPISWTDKVKILKESCRTCLSIGTSIWQMIFKLQLAKSTNGLTILPLLAEILISSSFYLAFSFRSTITTSLITSYIISTIKLSH